MANSSVPRRGKPKLYRIVEVGPEELEGMKLSADDEREDPYPRGHSDHGVHHHHDHSPHHDHDHPGVHIHRHPH